MREYAIELFFDSVTEWDTLERHTNAKTPLQRRSRPHLSLISGTIDQLETLNPYLQLSARQFALFEIQFI